MGSETACVWINTSIMIVRSSKSRSEAVSLPTVDTVTCHGFGHEDHQVEDFDVQGSGNEPHRAVSALHLGEGVMKSSAGRSHGEKRNIVLPLSARRKTRCYVENQTRCYVLQPHVSYGGLHRLGGLTVARRKALRRTSIAQGLSQTR